MHDHDHHHDHDHDHDGHHHPRPHHHPASARTQPGHRFTDPAGVLAAAHQQAHHGNAGTTHLPLGQDLGQHHIELLVAFLQAFIFTLLSATYFAAATEEAHH